MSTNPDENAASLCPSFCIVDSLLHVGRCSQDWLAPAPRVPVGNVAVTCSISSVNDDSVSPVTHGEVILGPWEVVDPKAEVSDLDVAR